MTDRELTKHQMWVFTEQRGGVLHHVGLELLGAARKLTEKSGGTVTAILIGNGIEALLGELSTHGAHRILCVQHPDIAVYQLMPYVSVLHHLCRQYNPDSFLFGATSMGVELAPRLAARLNTGLSAHCIDLDIDSDGNLLQAVPGWGGGVVATIRTPNHRPQMATVMPGVMKKMKKFSGETEIVHVDISEVIDVSGPRVVRVYREEPQGILVENADVVVAGGWGVGGKKGWKLIEELSTVLCGAVGATRPPVDEEWAQEEQMIGQSGKTVRPRLYIGVGISGMMHHVVGMDESGYVVAINTDPKAAIFTESDIAVVADYREILPILIDELKKRRVPHDDVAQSKEERR